MPNLSLFLHGPSKLVHGPRDREMHAIRSRHCMQTSVRCRAQKVHGACFLTVARGRRRANGGGPALRSEHSARFRLRSKMGLGPVSSELKLTELKLTSDMMMLSIADTVSPCLSSFVECFPLVVGSTRTTSLPTNSHRHFPLPHVLRSKLRSHSLGHISPSIPYMLRAFLF
jgi:hypothetical protein